MIVKTERGMVKVVKSDNTKTDSLMNIDLLIDQTQEMFLPVHNYVELYPAEIAIINLPAFQR